MAKYRVMVTEPVTYSITVTAASEKKARKKALSAHEDGVTVEVDSGPVEVTDVHQLDGE